MLGLARLSEKKESDHTAECPKSSPTIRRAVRCEIRIALHLRAPLRISGVRSTSGAAFETETVHIEINGSRFTPCRSSGQAALNRRRSDAPCEARAVAEQWPVRMLLSFLSDESKCGFSICFGR